MRISKEKFKVKCDMGCCKNLSEYAIEVDDNKRHNVHICMQCFNELYSLMAREVTPSSVQNVVKRAENKRNEWNRKEN